MRCPVCNHANFGVSNSRKRQDELVVWRRRHCPACSYTLTTFENPQVDKAFFIQHGPRKKDRQIYRSAHLLKAILAACTHLSDSTLPYELLLRIEKELFKRAAKSNFVISKQEAEQLTIKVLAAYDKAAAVTYAAQHGLDATF